MITEFSETDNEKRWVGDFDSERTLNIWDTGETSNWLNKYVWIDDKQKKR